MNVNLTGYQSNIIKGIAETLGFDEYQLETNSGSSKGDGALGNIIAVEIKSDTRKLDLIVKSAETNVDVRKTFPIRKVYLREIYIYEHVFPEFEKFQKAKCLFGGYYGYPKMYGVYKNEGEEVLVLDNLKKNGYKMWNRKMPMDSAHVALVMTEYAKFHAVSLAMRIKAPHRFREITDNLGNIFDNNSEITAILKSSIQKNIIAAKNDCLITDALKRLSDKVEQFLLKDINYSEDQLVLTHGDCWSNNMMFQYEDPGDEQKPTKVCLFDWQLSKTGSPVLDLAFFLFVCSTKNIFNDYRKYLRHYHEVVTSNLMMFSCDPNIFPYSLLEIHWKKYAKFGLYNALLTLKLVLSKQDEILDLDEIAKTGRSLADRFSDSIQTTDYNNRILDIVKVLVENDLID